MMTTEMLTVAGITAHGHQCKPVDSISSSEEWEWYKKWFFPEPTVTKRQTNVPDIPHNLSSNFL